ncbi:flagellar hook-associated protein FlgL [Clostridium sp. JNZ X4-2]
MRVTNKLLSNNFLSDMQRNLTNLSKVQKQMSSMKNFSKPSDDPINVQRAMQLQSSIDYNDQYATNIKAAQGWMQTTDTALVQLNTVIGKIRNNLETSGNAAYTQDERDKINDEVNQEVSQLAQILNTNFKGEYIFGGTAGLSKPVSTSTYDITRSTTDSDGNPQTDIYNDCISLQYSDKNGSAVSYLPDVVSSGFDIGNWSSKAINFTIEEPDPDNSGETIEKPVEITAMDTSGNKTIDDVVKDLNDKIQTSDLKDKVNVVKTNDGNIKFIAVNSSDVIKIDSSDISDLSGTIGKQLSNMSVENIGSEKNIEVSQGVVLSYNATAVDVMNYGTGAGDNIPALMDRIEHHLAGQVWDCEHSDGSAVDSTESGAVEGADGKYYTWVDNQSEATKQLTNKDMEDIDAASKQIMKVDSQIGAKEKRMDGLSSQNSSSKVDMTDILSKTEDIDITEKTIEYSTMITIYQACLQTGAKIMQPTLMDYIK